VGDRCGALAALAGIGAVLGALLLAIGLWQQRAQPAADAAEPPPLAIAGEYEPQAALLLASHDLLRQQPELLAEIAEAVHARLELWILASHAQDLRQAGALFEARGIPPERVRFVPAPVETMWVRDFGPLFGRTPDGAPVLLDFEHPEGARRAAPRAGDDAAPALLAELLGLPRRALALKLGNGNFVGNGDGLFVSTWAAVLDNRDKGHDLDSMGRELARALALREWLVLAPLQREPTHDADMFVSFPAPDVALVGRLDPAEDAENAAILDQAAALLAGRSTSRGPLRVERIPMPPPEGEVWRSYTNVIYANGLLLVPSFADVDPALEAAAFRVWREQLPGWEIRGLRADAVARRGGLLHCLSQTLPGYIALPEPASAAPR